MAELEIEDSIDLFGQLWWLHKILAQLGEKTVSNFLNLFQDGELVEKSNVQNLHIPTKSPVRSPKKYAENNVVIIYYTET